MTILSESTCRIATDFGKLLLIIGISCLVASVMLTVNDYHKACVITVIIGLIVIAIFCAFFVENHRRIKVVLSDGHQWYDYCQYVKERRGYRPKYTVCDVVKSILSIISELNELKCGSFLSVLLCDISFCG